MTTKQFIPVYTLNWPNHLSRDAVSLFRAPRSEWEKGYYERILGELKQTTFKELSLNTYFIQQGVLFRKTSTKTARLITDVDSTRTLYFHGRNQVITFSDELYSKKFINFESLRGKFLTVTEEEVQEILVNKLGRDGVKDSGQLAIPEPKQPKQPIKDATKQTIIRSQGTQEDLVKQLKNSVDELTSYLNSRNDSDKLPRLGLGDNVIVGDKQMTVYDIMFQESTGTYTVILNNIKQL